MKINDIMDKFAMIEKKRAERDQKIASTKEEIAKLEEQKAQAMSSGQTDSYKALKSEIEDKKMDLEVLEGQGYGIAVSPAEINSAWGEYAKDHSKQLTKQLTKIESARGDLRTAYENALRLQNEALWVREKLAAYAGEDRGNFVMANLPSESRPIPGNMKLKSPEANYMIETGMWPVDLMGDDAVQDAFSIINMERPVNKLHF